MENSYISTNNIIKNWIKNNDDSSELKLNDLQLKDIYLPNIVKYCNLSNNNFTEFEINEDSDLVSLNISKNKLNNIILNKKLTYLNLSDNLFESIKFTSDTLQLLNLSNNNLSNLNLSGFVNLIDLNLSNNNLSSFYMTETSNINFLDISNNKIQEISNIPNKLLVLKCNNNKITKINKLNDVIQELNCENNLLTDLLILPDSLLYINIQYNKISKATLQNILQNSQLNKYLQNQLQLQLNTQITIDDNEILKIKELYIDNIRKIITNNTDYKSYINDLKIYTKTEKNSASDIIVMSGELNHTSLNIFEKYTKINILNNHIFIKSFDTINNFLNYKTDNSLDTEVDIYNSIIYELLQNKNTPHLINYYGSNINNNNKYLVFEKLENTSLHEYLLNLKIPTESLLVSDKFLKNTNINKIYIIFFQIFYTLYCLYSKHLIHNDLHLGNILVEKKPTNYVYEILEHKIQIKTDICIKIFDFDRSSCYNNMCQRNFKLDNLLCEYHNQCNGFYYKKDIVYVIINIFRLLYNKLKTSEDFLKNNFDSDVEDELPHKTNKITNVIQNVNTQIQEFLKKLFVIFFEDNNISFNEILLFCRNSPNNKNINFTKINNVSTILYNILSVFKKSSQSYSAELQKTTIDFVKVYNNNNSSITINYIPPIKKYLTTYSPLLKSIKFIELLTSDKLNTNLNLLYTNELKMHKYDLQSKSKELYDIILNTVNQYLNKTNDEFNKNLYEKANLEGFNNSFIQLILENLNILKDVCDLLANPIIYGIPNGFFLFISINIKNKMIAINIYNAICDMFNTLPIEILNMHGNSTYNISTNADIGVMITSINYFKSIKDYNSLDKFLLKFTNILLFIDNNKYNDYSEYLFNLILSENDVNNTNTYVLKYYLYYYNNITNIPQSLKPTLNTLKTELINLNDEYINTWIYQIQNFV
jgi:hypothetical protein